MRKGASNCCRQDGTEHRPAHRAWIVFFLVATLSACILGVGHQHPEDETLGEHQCVVCHVQLVTVEPASFAVQIWPAALPVRASALAMEPAVSLSVRHTPLLRGPPTA